MKKFFYLILFNLLTQNSFGTIQQKFKKKNFGKNEREISTKINNSDAGDKTVFNTIVEVYRTEGLPLSQKQRRNIMHKAALNFIVNYIDETGIDTTDLNVVSDTMNAIHILDPNDKKGKFIEIANLIDNETKKKVSENPNVAKEITNVLQKRINELQKRSNLLSSLEELTETQKEELEKIETEQEFLDKGINDVSFEYLPTYRAFASPESWKRTLSIIAGTVAVTGAFATAAHYGLLGESIQKAMHKMEKEVKKNTGKLYNEITRDPDFLKAKEAAAKETAWKKYKESNPIKGFAFETLNFVSAGFFNTSITGQINLTDNQKEMLTTYFKP